MRTSTTAKGAVELTGASPRWIVSALIVILVASVTGGAYAYVAQRHQAREAAESKLLAVAHMRAEQVARWRTERLEEATSAATVGALLDGHGSSDDAIDVWLQALIGDNRHAQALIVDADGAVLYRGGGSKVEFYGHPRDVVGEAVRKRGPIMSDLHTDTSDLAPHVDVVVPLAASSAPGRAAVLVLRTHAASHLYPLLDAWPADSPSAETLLVRRDGGAAVFLSGRRHDGAPPLTERLPLDNRALPAARAVTGTTGIVEGTDYRGVSVLAALLPVPDSTWFIVAKVDMDEALAAWRRQSTLLLIAMLGLAALVITTLAAVWQRGRKARYRALFRAEAARRQSEVAVLRNESILRESQRVARIGHYSLDFHSGIWTDSETLEDILGIDESYPHDVAGWLALIDEQWRPAMTEHLKVHVVQEGQAFDKEYPITRPADGTRRWVHGRGRLRYDAGGSLAELFGTIQDITERKEAEAAMELAREAAEAERSSLEEQLRHAQKLEGIGRLAGGVAHDFNNILCVVTSCAELAMEGLEPSDPAQLDLSEIRRAADRGAQLTRQLLAFSRRQIMQPIVADLNDVVGGMEPMLRRLIGEDVTLVVRAAPALRSVRVDPGQIEQAVMNMVVNSRDAMPDGGTLIIATENLDLGVVAGQRHAALAPGPYVVIRVTDTGGGITPEVTARLFEPFFTTKERGKGTGLGLATAYGIVRQSGGDIRVASSPGVGSTFEIILPHATGVAIEPRATTLIAALAVGTETILIAEDEEPVRRAVGRILTAAGYTVLSAGSGEEALRICRGHKAPIHLLLTDVIMPGMSGKELVERVAAVCTDMATLYMSGYTDDTIVRRGALEPDTNFIGKPFTAADLTARVRQVLDAHRTHNVYDISRRRATS